MTKSKTKISRQTQKKTSSELVKTIFLAKKNDNWKRVAEILSGPRRNRINPNLNEIEGKANKEGTIVIPGKVLSQGEIKKKIKISALDFSEVALEKLKKVGCEISYIKDEIKKNPNGNKINILENENNRR